MAETIDLNTEKNFFETRVKEYQRGGGIKLGLTGSDGKKRRGLKAFRKGVENHLT